LLLSWPMAAGRARASARAAARIGFTSGSIPRRRGHGGRRRGRPIMRQQAERLVAFGVEATVSATHAHRPQAYCPLPIARAGLSSMPNGARARQAPRQGLPRLAAGVVDDRALRSRAHGHDTGTAGHRPGPMRSCARVGRGMLRATPRGFTDMERDTASLLSPAPVGRSF
jgi:hypothetical protein